MLASYTVPKVDVLVSFIGRSTLNASAGVGFGGFEVVRFGGSRATVGIDLYNAFNSNTPIGFATGFDPNNVRGYQAPGAAAGLS